MQFYVCAQDGFLRLCFNQRRVVICFTLIGRLEQKIIVKAMKYHEHMFCLSMFVNAAAVSLNS